MNLHIVRQDCLKTLERHELSQQGFAQKYGLSFSWLNKFLNGKAENPRLNSLLRLQDAIEAERRAS